MNRALVDRIANAVLYEGYLLYPYRPSVKNRERWTFGGLYPPAYSQAQEGMEPSSSQTECLIACRCDTRVNVRVRFLHLLMRRNVSDDAPTARESRSLAPGLAPPSTWQEAVEREVDLGELEVTSLLTQPRDVPFDFPASRAEEPWRTPSGEPLGAVVREHDAVAGRVLLAAEAVTEGLVKFTVQVLNETPFDVGDRPDRDAALLRALVSTHTILEASEGEFISLIDPPGPYREAAAACRNVGDWPVLVGDPGQRNTMLSSPIILYDYPQIAPESPGDLFDATEIDEILTLRILTLTDDEKHAMAAIDDRARALLERTEALAREQLLGLHGTIRGLQPWTGGATHDPWGSPDEPARLESIRVAGVEYRRGSRVRLWPLGDADILDLALKGKLATISAIEKDYDDRIHLAVTVDDDPGKDFGAAGQPGHRFYFRPEELEPLDDAEGGINA